MMTTGMSRIANVTTGTVERRATLTDPTASVTAAGPRSTHH